MTEKKLYKNKTKQTQQKDIPKFSHWFWWNFIYIVFIRNLGRWCPRPTACDMVLIIWKYNCVHTSATLHVSYITLEEYNI